MKYAAIILVCIVVAGAMTVVLHFFFRRLNEIEVQRWGDKAKADTQESLSGAISKLFRIRRKK